jgi:hypothetical protein
MWRSIILVFICAVSCDAYAHSGRTNAQGCHNDRKNGGYHCHNGGTTRASAPTHTPSVRSSATQLQNVVKENAARTTVTEDFYMCVQEVQRLAENYSATLLSNTAEQYRVELEMEDGRQIVTCLATHQKTVEHSQ